jgi:S-adenosylmethionine:tRNA ribosyltransferase-isomerase
MRGRSPISSAHLDFVLPPESIAREPVRPRDGSRLLVIDRRSPVRTDSFFRALATHLRPGDTLVLNNTRVLNARAFGTVLRSGRRVEILFATPLRDDAWGVLLGPARRVRSGDVVTLGPGSELVVGRTIHHGLREVRPSGAGHATISDLMAARGTLPLPPYLEREARSSDEVDYQTIYGTEPGAIAAPTAGLHFSAEVFDSLRAAQIEIVKITLHVGIGTFLPVRTEDPARHVLEPERYEVSGAAARVLNEARSGGRRIVAVGTTTTRTLEHVFARNGQFVPGKGETDLYILPGYRFQAIDGLITNFHLPRSTLVLLAAAFASPDRVLGAYRHAIASGYRFYSYGDCCLFL